MQSDYLDTNTRESIGVNNYLIKTINDCTGVGARFEWWNTTRTTAGGESFDTYNLTLGVNHRQCANLTWRPEVRYDWYDGLMRDGNVVEDSFKFAVDAVMTF